MRIAVVFGLSSLSPQECREGIESDTRVKVQIIEPGPSSVVTVGDIHRWLDRPSFDSAELAIKRRLRGLLAS